MTDICSLSLTQVASELQARKIGVAETVNACLERIDTCEPQIGALITIARDEARALAAKMDAQKPDPQRPLWGVPVIVKDALSTKNLRTTAASLILDNFVPFYDAHVVHKLREAGAIILAKANMDEFAMGSSTENSAFRKTRNPWNLEHVPGGSSGGSAAAVTAGECFAALGSDTGGSIRQPAAFCGCAGLKPTYGRVSRYGLFAFASSLDQVGPIARTVEDIALMLNVIGGHDPRDSTSAMEPMEDYAANLAAKSGDRPLAGTRIGLPSAFISNGLATEVRDVIVRAADLARDLGAEIIDITLPDPNIASATYYIVAMAEASSNLARYDGVRYGRRAPDIDTLDELYLQSRSQGFGNEVKRRIMLGSYVLSSGYYDAYFKKAAQTRRLIQMKYFEALGQCDLLLMPVAPVTAWKLGENEQDPLKTYLMDAYTLPVNLAGLPGLSIPAGMGAESSMPVGIQLVGKPFAESAILRCGHILEKALPPLGIPTGIRDIISGH